MDIAVTGSTGLIGAALVRALEARGDRVLRLVRPGARPSDGTAVWDPAAGTIDAAALGGIQAVVNLAGVPIGTHRWTEALKTQILESRVQGTTLLATTLAGMDQPPEVLVSASASGYYGDRGDEVLTEESISGMGYLADVCRQWEAATRPAEAGGIRVTHLRTGIVLSPEGGALGRMLPIFKTGMGGRLGPGTQWWSWIDLADEVGAILHLISESQARGAFNLVAPNPVTNAELTSTLAHVLGRPAGLSVPKLALRVAFGGFADEGLLASQRLQPRRLTESGYRFQSPELEPALRAMLGR